MSGTHMTRRVLPAVAGAFLLMAGVPAASAAQTDQLPAVALAPAAPLAPSLPRQESAQPPGPDHLATTETRTVPAARYQLTKGDVLELQFPFVSDFNQTVTIQPDGFITLRIVGAVGADGLTVPELTQTVRAAYASTLRDPVVTIELKEFEKPYFIVAGEVERPGKYDLRGEITATQAIAVAGGLRERAKHSKATIFRRLPAGSVEARTIDLKKMLKEGQLGADVRLESGDMVFIPRGQRIKITDITSSLWVLGWVF